MVAPSGSADERLGAEVRHVVAPGQAITVAVQQRAVEARQPAPRRAADANAIPTTKQQWPRWQDRYRVERRVVADRSDRHPASAVAEVDERVIGACARAQGFQRLRSAQD